MRPAIAALVAAAAACDAGDNPVASDAAPGDAAPACLASPDARPACSPADEGCEPFLHCGCAATQKCTVGTVGLECAPAGDGEEGEPCAGDGECARGTICVPFLGATRCMRFCDAAHTCPSGEACYIVVTDRQQPARQVAEVCGPMCSLLSQSCVGSGLGCYVSEKLCAAERGLCLASGRGEQTSPCARMSDCAAGHLCIDHGGPAPPICAKICGRKGTEPTCHVGTTCRDLPGHIQTGICLP